MSIDIIISKLSKLGWSIDEHLKDQKKAIRFKKNGFEWETPRSLVSYPLSTKKANEIAKNKDISYELMKKIKINVPEYVSIQTAESLVAKKFLKKYKRVVVKPNDNRGSVGVELDIKRTKNLNLAIKEALKHSNSAVVQEYYDGKEVRFTVLNKKIISIIEKRPAMVVGDGRTGLQRLIDKENSEREEINKHSGVLYPKLTLPKNLKPELILKSKEKLKLSDSSLIREGASAYEVEVHPDYSNIALKAAKVLDSNFIVVDLFIKNYSKSASSTNYRFLEFNSGPALVMYESIRNNRHSTVIEKICLAIDQLANR